MLYSGKANPEKKAVKKAAKKAAAKKAQKAFTPKVHNKLPDGKKYPKPPKR